MSSVENSIIRGFFACETILRKLFKPLIAAVAAAPLFAGAAFAGPYVNVEANASYPDGEYSNATTDLHVGYEGSLSETADFYAQVGPGFVHTEADDETVTEISGKVGVTVAATDSLGVYGELAGITGEDSSGDDIIDWAAKVGAKYVF